jgi:hypothetical protein
MRIVQAKAVHSRRYKDAQPAGRRYPRTTWRFLQNAFSDRSDRPHLHRRANAARLANVATDPCQSTGQSQRFAARKTKPIGHSLLDIVNRRTSSDTPSCQGARRHPHFLGCHRREALARAPLTVCLADRLARRKLPRTRKRPRGGRSICCCRCSLALRKPSWSSSPQLSSSLRWASASVRLSAITV